MLRADDRLLAGLVAGFAQERRHGGLGSSLYVEALKQAAGIDLLRHHAEVQFREPETRGRRSAIQGRRLASDIEDNLDHAVTLAELAGAVGLSMFHFTRKFRSTLGCHRMTT
ncbi:helix-turn-helix transcriptional regulator [Methylobacterium sp. ID0610]|uniref:helix-turn-helix transcriptional regulator n=1 Tax=Methylobacterium carpenticola TaxID=3344827 RepID=UPI0036BF73CF